MYKHPYAETCTECLFCFAVLPGAFQSAVHGIITGTNYSAGVQATLRAGGCNASRGGFIGACLGAQVRKEIEKQ